MDEAAFETLFAAHFDDVWRFARRRCASAEAADDLAAEAFAVAWRRRADLPQGHEARLWLFGAARRVLANHLRGEQRRSRLHERLGSVWSRATAPDPPTWRSATRISRLRSLGSGPPDAGSAAARRERSRSRPGPGAPTRTTGEDFDFGASIDVRPPS